MLGGGGEMLPQSEYVFFLFMNLYVVYLAVFAIDQPYDNCFENCYATCGYTTGCLDCLIERDTA